MENKDEVFRFTYSAKEQTEIENIRRKYMPPEADKMEQLRRLDAIPHQKAQIWALSLGILGALILGAGMSLCMTELGEVLNMAEEVAFLVGVVLGLPGLGMVALAYPVYNRILKKARQRLAPQILKLTDELMK